jgi:hypothetical protein
MKKRNKNIIHRKEKLSCYFSCVKLYRLHAKQHWQLKHTQKRSRYERGTPTHLIESYSAVQCSASIRPNVTRELPRAHMMRL